MSARHTTGTMDSEELNQNPGYGTPAYQTHEIPNDSTIDYFSHEKYNFQHHQTTIHEQPIHHNHKHHNQQQQHHHQRQESDDSLSVRSIQVSQSSFKPLHEPSL
ncbi:hypothetical protein INT45_000437 [Circinella minor]|uniref:Uncharacterized protein n=1 Tax=Circinella minor TaxID=1195481 RepID=A0A8H7VKP5_9FUNG|nr:hypothetical protein INT45_000437 [Circinella minor]